MYLFTKKDRDYCKCNVCGKPFSFKSHRYRNTALCRACYEGKTPPPKKS